MRYTVSALICIAILQSASAVAQDDTNPAELRRQNELLQAKLEAATLKIDKLEKELAEMKSKTDAAPVVDLLPLGSKWTGKFIAVHQGKSTTNSATCNVTSRDGGKGTFSNSLENGTVWEYDFELTSKTAIKITAVRRIKAANGTDTKGLPPVGGTTGKGSVSAKKLTINTYWKDATGGPLEGKYEFSRE